MTEKTDTAILVSMERLVWRQTSVSKWRGSAFFPVGRPCLERLAKRCKCFRTAWSGICYVHRASRSSHPRAGWGHASYTRGVPAGGGATMPLLLLLQFCFCCIFLVRARGRRHCSRQLAVCFAREHTAQTTNDAQCKKTKTTKTFLYKVTKT